jgi:hypothetical protein
MNKDKMKKFKETMIALVYLTLLAAFPVAVSMLLTLSALGLILKIIGVW